MKTPPISPNRIQRVTELAKLRTTTMLAAATGNYKEFKESTKAFAKIAVEDLDAMKELPAQKITVPLFSKAGLNMAKVWFLNKFRIKTPEEKLVKKWSNERTLENKINKSI